MRWLNWLMILVLALTLLAAGCDKNDDDDDNNNPSDDDDSTPVDDDQTTDDDAAGDDDAVDDDTPPLVSKFRFDLDFEVDFSAMLQIREYEDGSQAGRFTATDGFDATAAGTVLEGNGQKLQFPEAFGRILTLKFQGPAVAAGLCGDQPMSYSLTLTAKENNGYMVGGLAAYCGAETYTGRVARIQRLPGLQEHEE